MKKYEMSDDLKVLLREAEAASARDIDRAMTVENS